MSRYTPLWLQQGSYAASVDRRLVAAIWPTPASSGAAATVSGGTMSVSVAAGSCAVPTQNGTGSTLCVWDASELVTHSAAPGSPNSRIDIITVHPRGNDLDSGSNNDFIIDIVAGTPATSPTAPAVPAGQVGIWQVMVPTGAAALVQGNLTDIRPGGLGMLGPSSTNRYQVRAYRTAAFTFPATANAETNLVYDTKTAGTDPTNAYNASTGVYTCPAAGMYLVRHSWSISGVAGSTLNLNIYQNGVQNSRAFSNPPATTSAALLTQQTGLLVCAAGDTINFTGSSATASVASRNGNITECYMAIVNLGPP